MNVKESNKAKIKITPKISAVKAIAALAAGLALVAFIPALFSANSISISESAADYSNEGISDKSDASADYSDEAADEAEDYAPVQDSAEEEAADGYYDDYVPSYQPKSYEELKFDSYSETVYTCTGEPYGGDYFVEDEILAETDCFVVAVVKDVSLCDDGSSIIYTLETRSSYNAESVNTETVSFVESRSVYTMKRGRTYLLPLVKTENGYRTAYDNVPQMEFTADGGLVYYNGWSSLDSEYSNSITYPQKTVDDFFYDRMMITGAGYYGLIERFCEIKEL